MCASLEAMVNGQREDIHKIEQRLEALAQENVSLKFKCEEISTRNNELVDLTSTKLMQILNIYGYLLFRQSLESTG